jgi:hypothetical protein
VFVRSGFAQRPKLRNQLDQPQLFQLILGVGGEGQDKKSATLFFKPGRYNISTLNSGMKVRWCCWLGEMGTESWDKAVTSG